MASATTIPKCATCKKTKTDTAASLKHCAKCQITFYCSRDCQKTDWKNHKKTCVSNATESVETISFSTSHSSSFGASPALAVAVNKPYHRLNDRTWLHDRPEGDVYKLLIDTYRFRMQDNFTWEGDRSQGSIYAGEVDGRVGFETFLRLASTNSLLPLWWSKGKADECMALGLDENSWSSLARKVDKSQLIEHYGNAEIQMQLRLFSEQVYGRGPGGQKGDKIINMRMQQERSGGYGSNIDTSSLIGRV